MKKYRGVEVYLRLFFISALGGGEWLVWCGPEGRAPATHWTGGWMVPRAGLNVVTVGRNILVAPAGNSTPVVHSVRSHRTDINRKWEYIHVFRLIFRFQHVLLNDVGPGMYDGKEMNLQVINYWKLEKRGAIIRGEVWGWNMADMGEGEAES